MGYYEDVIARYYNDLASRTNGAAVGQQFLNEAHGKTDVTQIYALYTKYFDILYSNPPGTTQPAGGSTTPTSGGTGTWSGSGDLLVLAGLGAAAAAMSGPGRRLITRTTRRRR